MQTKTIELFKFSELPEDIQEKVIERNRYINVEDGFWHDYDGKMGFSAKELSRMRMSVKDSPDELITYKNVWFDTGRSWYIQFQDAEFTDDETARRFLRVPRQLWDLVDWTINDTPYRETNTRLEYERKDGEEFTHKQIEILDRAVEIFADKVEQALRDLEKNYEYYVSDESIIETLEINENTFREDGRIEY